MAVTTKNLARTAATTNTATVLYTVPASTTTVLTGIAVTNTAGTAGTFTLALGPSGSQVNLHTTSAIGANTTVYVDCKLVLSATHTITGGASATTINFNLNGVEIA